MFKKISKILVPLDGSKHSNKGLCMAIGMAVQYKAAITGIISIDVPSFSEFQSAHDIIKDPPKKVKQIMKHSKMLATKNNIVFESKIVYGNVGYNILKMAHSKKENFDLIVIGSRGRGSVKEMFFGSVSNYVIHASKIPVLIIK